jgi:hypothetical protein
MKKQTVHQLRKNGWKVKVGHKRVVYRFDAIKGFKHTRLCLIKDWNELYPNFFLSAKGGLTEVCITSPEGVTHTDYAVCNDTDHYDSKIGLAIALGRTMQHFENVS